MHRVARLALLAGTTIVVFGLSKAHAVAHEYDWSASSRLVWSFGYIGALCLSAYGFGLPDQTRTRKSTFVASMGAAATAAVLVSIAQLFVGSALLPRFVVLGSALVLVPWYVLCASLAGDARSRAEDRARVLVVAEPDEVCALKGDLERAPERAAVVIGSLAPSSAASTSTPPCRPVLDLARAQHATVLVLSRAAQSDDDLVTQAAILHEEGVRIRTLSLFYEQWLGKLPIGELERVSLLFDIGELHGARYSRIKRLFDIALACCGLVALAVITPVVALGDLIANRGPLFYRQARIGRNGTPFDILKFRTMRAADFDEADAPEWTTEGDARITPFGRFLRRTHLDELPQVVNILRGDLSVVGPRPEQPKVVNELVDKLPFYRLRDLVRPGLTGWAQVKFQYASSEAETLEKLQYEFFYLRRQSLMLDLRIIGRTIRSVIGRDGR